MLHEKNAAIAVHQLEEQVGLLKKLLVKLEAGGMSPDSLQEELKSVDSGLSRLRDLI